MRRLKTSSGRRVGASDWDERDRAAGGTKMFPAARGGSMSPSPIKGKVKHKSRAITHSPAPEENNANTMVAWISHHSSDRGPSLVPIKIPSPRASEITNLPSPRMNIGSPLAQETKPMSTTRSNTKSPRGGGNVDGRGTDQRASEAESLIRLLQSRLEQKELELTEVKVERDAVQQMVSQIEGKLSGVSTGWEQALKREAQQREALQEMARSKRVAEMEATSLRNDFKQHELEKITWVKETEALKQELAEAQKEAAMCKHQLQASQKLVADQKGQLDDRSIEGTTMAEALKLSERKREELLQDLQDLRNFSKEKENKAEDDKSRLEDKIKKLEKDKAELKQKLETVSTQERQLQENLERLDQQLKHTSQERTALQTELSEVKATAADSAQESSQMQVEVIKMREELTTLSGDLGESEIQLSEHKIRVEELESTLHVHGTLIVNFKELALRMLSRNLHRTEKGSRQESLDKAFNQWTLTARELANREGRRKSILSTALVKISQTALNRLHGSSSQRLALVRWWRAHKLHPDETKRLVESEDERRKLTTKMLEKTIRQGLVLATQRNGMLHWQKETAATTVRSKAAQILSMGCVALETQHLSVLVASAFGSWKAYCSCSDTISTRLQARMSLLCYQSLLDGLRGISGTKSAFAKWRALTLEQTLIVEREDRARGEEELHSLLDKGREMELERQRLEEELKKAKELAQQAAATTAPHHTNPAPTDVVEERAKSGDDAKKKADVAARIEDLINRGDTLEESIVTAHSDPKSEAPQPSRKEDVAAAPAGDAKEDVVVDGVGIVPLPPSATDVLEIEGDSGGEVEGAHRDGDGDEVGIIPLPPSATDILRHEQEQEHHNGVAAPKQKEEHKEPLKEEAKEEEVAAPSEGDELSSKEENVAPSEEGLPPAEGKDDSPTKKEQEVVTAQGAAAESENVVVPTKENEVSPATQTSHPQGKDALVEVESKEATTDEVPPKPEEPVEEDARSSPSLDDGLNMESPNADVDGASTSPAIDEAAINNSEGEGGEGEISQEVEVQSPVVSPLPLPTETEQRERPPSPNLRVSEDDPPSIQAVKLISRISREINISSSVITWREYATEIENQQQWTNVLTQHSPRIEMTKTE